MSDFEVSIAEQDSKDEWDDYVHKSKKGTFFHLYDWLLISEEKTDFELLPLLIKRNNQVVGVAPFFIKSIPGIKIAMSPPPRMSMPWAGPVFEFQSDKPYKIEKNTTKVINTLHKYLKDKIKVDYIRVKTTDKITDIRPFKWLSYKCSPNYTYILDIKNTEKVYKEFDGRIRTGVRNAKKTDHLDYHHDKESFTYDVLEATIERYKEQGIKFPLSKAVFGKILNSKLKEYICTISVTDEKGFVTGNIMIVYKDAARHWIGGLKPVRNYSGVNEYLHWNGIKKFSEEGYKKYEFMGGNTKHLCSHKSKYSGDLVSYYSCRWNNYKGVLLEGVRKIIS